MLPLPPHYEPAHAARWDFAPDPAALAAAAADWAREHHVPAAAADARRVELLVIDAQRDFTFPRGALYVGGRSGRGAVEDNDRLARFVYANLAAITGITCTLDTHFPYQVFFPTFWEGRDGEPVGPHREVTADDVRGGALRPRRELARWLCEGDHEWLVRQAQFYCEELERAGKYRLYLWPLHCLAGGDGHALAGVIQEARLFHAFARRAPDPLELKGGHPLTENYSVLAPEVLLRHDGGELAQRNGPLFDRLLQADALYVAGQASSHCVRSSVDDLLDEIARRDPALASRVHVLVDCMSAVAVPDGSGGFLADFTPQAEAALARWEAAGIRLVRSTDEIAPA
jgi:nicotinamidase-related amidase